MVTGPFVSPTNPDNRPTPIFGDTNGEMPPRDLVGVAPDCMAARAAGPSLGLLLATARDMGVVLGVSQCYRSLSDQVADQQMATAAGNSACSAPLPTTPSGMPIGTSMHGWGKAADFTDAQGQVLFGTAAENFLDAEANRFGWNHPGFALPGGSACPDPPHWEWVGDGGDLHDSTVRADVVALLPSADGRGYSTVTGLGALGHHGDAPDYGSAAGDPLGWIIVGGARTPDGRGYWLVGSDGTVFPFGTARSFGSIRSGTPPTSVVGMAATPDGRGYWLVGADGHVFTFGDAAFYGSPAASSRSLTRPVVAMAATRDGHGYWVVAADGAVFNYGDAKNYGSASGRPLPAPVVAAAATPDGRGYWLASADGSAFAFGDAAPPTTTASVASGPPVVAIAPTPSGRGYWLTTADGAVFGYGDAQYYGAG